MLSRRPTTQTGNPKRDRRFFERKPHGLVMFNRAVFLILCFSMLPAESHAALQESDQISVVEPVSVLPGYQSNGITETPGSSILIRPLPEITQTNGAAAESELLEHPVSENRNQFFKPLPKHKAAESTGSKSQTQISGTSSTEDELTLPQLEGSVRQALHVGWQKEPFDLGRTIETLLKNSPAVKIAKYDVAIAETNAIREQAAFDWENFIESTWAETNQPVASALDGAEQRLENHDLIFSAGLRKRTTAGGNLSVQQDAGFSDSNSEFFDPQNQANANIAISIEQPLLRGRGVVATSQFQIAQADTMLSRAEFINQLQGQIELASNQYWDLVAARGDYFIQRRTLRLGTEIINIIENRVGIDTGPQQLIRAKSNLASRQRDLVRAKYALLSRQEQLLQLILGTNYAAGIDVELVTTAAPVKPELIPNLEQEIDVALSHRPEVKRELASIRRASIQQGVTKNQLLPALDLAFAISNRGLRGNSALASAYNDQFNFGDPTYSFGLSYSLPVGNRAAKAAAREADFRIARFQTQLQQTIASIAFELKLVRIDLAKSIETVETAQSALEAANEDYRVRVERFKLGVDDPSGISGYLDNLFSSQDRLSSAQRDYITAFAEFCKLDLRLQRVRGTLCSEFERSAP